MKEHGGSSVFAEEEKIEEAEVKRMLTKAFPSYNTTLCEPFFTLFEMTETLVP